MASHFTPGHAARCGLTAALLAEHGFECSDSMIEGAKGFAVSFAQQANPDAAIDKLGELFEISTLAYKPYPSGVVIHPIIDACLDMVKAHTFDAAQIERIELTLNPLAAKLTDLVEPKDRGQALVSLQHWTAATLVYTAAGKRRRLRYHFKRTTRISASNFTSHAGTRAHLKRSRGDGVEGAHRNWKVTKEPHAAIS